MAWRIERKGIRYEWWCMFSSHGAAGGKAWTKRGAEKRLLRAQGVILAEPAPPTLKGEDE